MMSKSTNNSKSSHHQGSAGGGGGSGSGSGGGTKTTATTTKEQDRILNRIIPKSRISRGRIIFILFLAVLTGVLGYATYRLLTDAEHSLAQQQFESIADRALQQSYDIAMRQRYGVTTVASLIEHFFPSEDQWPFIDINGFEIWSKNIIKTSTGQSIGFLPIVYPNQIEEFQEFVSTTVYPDYGVNNNNTTIRITGLDATFQRYNETTELGGETHWNSPHKILLPFLYHSNGLFPPLLLANYHSIELRGKEIDDVIDCSIDSTIDDGEGRECSSLTDILDLSQKNPIETPAAVLIQPLFSSNSSKLTGFITSAIKWYSVLENVFSNEVAGIHCVISTQTQSFTYEIYMGEAILIGEGDLHQKEFTDFGQSIALNSPGTYSISSPNYTLSLYPTQDLFEVYATKNPVNATIGAICIVILTAILFFLYDWLVREEFNQKEAMEKARRQFVRFISHEVRTPLNAVCMGLQLLQDDAERILAYSSSNSTTICEQEHTDDDNDNNNNSNDDDEDVNGNDCSPQPTLFELSSSPPKKNNGFIAEEKVISAKLSTTTPITSTINSPSSLPPPPPPRSDNDDIKELTTRSEDTLHDKLREISGLSSDILSNATSAVDVLNDMLNYDKVESGTLQLEIAVFSIWELIEHTYTEFYQQAQYNNINYNLDYGAFLSSSDNQNAAEITSFSQLPLEAKSRKVVGDQIRITQVLRNLISNALKFTPENGTLTVRPDWKRDNTNGTTTMTTKIKLDSGEEFDYLNGGMLEVKVTDTGQGMNKEQLSRLFGEGVQFNVNKLQAGQGSGLGLYIAKGILEQHGGSLRADSEGIGHGTVFTMTTPLYYIPDPPEPEEPQHQRLRPMGYPHEKMEPLNILVVDDSPINRKMLTRLLQNHGHVCSQAEDGLAAIESVKNSMASAKTTDENDQRYYDAILMDYQMPNMDGPTATKEIRALGCDSFIVGVTGNVFAEDVSYFKECGANQVFAKPLEIRLLLDAFVEHGIG